MADTATTPQAPAVFVAYEIKPCVTFNLGHGEDQHTDSYERFADAELDAYEASTEVFWTLYGREAEGMALAIGDFISERRARDMAYRITRDERWLSDTTGLATRIDLTPPRFTDEERDIVLAALRLWQGADVIPEELFDIARGERGFFMTDPEIDDFCERLNV